MVDPSRSLSLLKTGRVVECQPLPWGSNETFCLLLEGDGGERCRAVYKPQAGEMPLWDFPEGTLYKREYAAYLVAGALGWPPIPPTVLRDGPYGVGAVQLLIPHDPRHHYFTLRESHAPQFRQVCLFDWLTNNADRKAGHCLLGPDGRVWCIDHGLTFNALPRLRTVIWEFAGEPVPPDLLRDVARLRRGLDRGEPWARELAGLLLPQEMEAFSRRLDLALSRRRFPLRSEGGVPWPPI